MLRLIATKEVKYANVVRKVGDVFEASDEDARMLKGWEKARDAAPDEQGASASDDGLFKQAEPPAADKPRRQYRRRDMVSES